MKSRVLGWLVGILFVIVVFLFVIIIEQQNQIRDLEEVAIDLATHLEPLEHQAGIPVEDRLYSTDVLFKFMPPEDL